MENFFEFYTAETDTNQANWLAERFAGSKYNLNAIIPIGFDSYVRILHPAWSVKEIDPNDIHRWDLLRAGKWPEAEDRTPVRWDSVASINDHSIHRLTQWNEISSKTFRERGAAGIDAPFEGIVTKEIVENLFEIFGDYSDPNQPVICGIWEGCSQFHKSSTLARIGLRYEEFVLFNSTLRSVRDGWLAAIEYSHETIGRAPNIMWPTTQEWFLAVNYSRQSSYIGGSDNIISAILKSKELEAHNALPGDKIF